MKKLRSSTKILATSLALAAGAYYGHKAWSDYSIGHEHFDPVAPGRVNLVGINPNAGYRIILANDVAQVVETQGGFGGKEDPSGGGASEGAIKKRVPMKELLGVLRGDGKALGDFVMKMNGINENDDSWPTTRVLWNKADIEKAIGDDPVLKPRLERALSVHLDGTPVVPLNRNSLENGIVVVSPVEMSVKVDGKPTLVKGEIMEPYKPNLVTATEAHYKDKANVDNAMVAGYYALEAGVALHEPAKRENVAASLRDVYSDARMRARLQVPRKMLDNATVVLNENAIADVKYRNYKTNDGKPLNDLTVDLNDEGRRRLWKFSKDHVGGQILLVADDVAIAAPRIEHELSLDEFTITQMPDEVLVREAVEAIKGKERMARQSPR